MNRTASILPAQLELVQDTTSAFIGYLAGLGSGKTRGAVLKALALGSLNPGVPGIFVEPVYSMVEDVAAAMFFEVFDEFGWREGREYRYSKRPPQWMDINLDTGKFRVLFRSSDNPRRMVAINAGWAIVDEADDHDETTMKNLAGRVRHPKAKVRQFVAVGTPENMGGWFQRWFETEPKPNTRLIRARTTDNHFLPEQYVQQHLAHFDDVDRQKYLEGLFVARAGRVYTAFRSDVHLMECESPGAGEQVMTCDFGLGCMAWVFGNVVDETVHYHGEQILENVHTIDAIDMSRKWWADFFERHEGRRPSEDVAASRVTVYCDPAGGEFFGASDIRLLDQAGYRVLHHTRHAPIKDRVNAVQVKLNKRELFVDPDGCPLLANALQNHTYDEKTGKPRKYHTRDGRRGLDHPVDSIGYHIEYAWPAATPRGNLYQWS